MSRTVVLFVIRHNESVIENPAYSLKLRTFLLLHGSSIDCNSSVNMHRTEQTWFKDCKFIRLHVPGM